MMNQQITKEILIEDLVGLLPESVVYLQKHGIRCLQCGEPTWGTLNQTAKEKNHSDEAIDKFIEDLNNMLLNL